MWRCIVLTSGCTCWSGSIKLVARLTSSDDNFSPWRTSRIFWNALGRNLKMEPLLPSGRRTPSSWVWQTRCLRVEETPEIPILWDSDYSAFIVAALWWCLNGRGEWRLAIQSLATLWTSACGAKSLSTWRSVLWGCTTKWSKWSQRSTIVTNNFALRCVRLSFSIGACLPFSEAAAFLPRWLYLLAGVARLRDRPAIYAYHCSWTVGSTFGKRLWCGGLVDGATGICSEVAFGTSAWESAKCERSVRCALWSSAPSSWWYTAALKSSRHDYSSLNLHAFGNTSFGRGSTEEEGQRGEASTSGAAAGRSASAAGVPPSTTIQQEEREESPQRLVITETPVQSQ